MKIILADHFGMCFGVRDAIAQAEQIGAKDELTILGELVHNAIVRERLYAQGIREAGFGHTLPLSARVMITAHGASDARRAKLHAAGFRVADATCPLVHHAHDALKRLVAAGFFPVVIGKAGHVEVEGLIGDFPDAIVLSSQEDVRRLPRSPRYGIISQTTQPIEFVRQIVDCIRQSYPDSDVRFVDTVCKPTKDRQSALGKLLAIADTIVVVGGRESNNTRQLVATCLAAGKAAFHVEQADELLSEWFEEVKTVGLTAGTSTLLETVQAVYRRLEEISAVKNQERT